MKKVAIILCLFLTTPCYSSSLTSLNGDEKQCMNKTTIKSDDLFSAPDDLICFFKTKVNLQAKTWNDLQNILNNTVCFKSDSDYCISNTTVCILGSIVPSDQIPTKIKKDAPYFVNKLCATAREGGINVADIWTNKKNITDCTDKKWKKNTTTNKTIEVLVVKNQTNPNGIALISKNDFPMQFYIEKNMPSTTNICVGYYCKTSNGKYQEPTDDGACSKPQKHQPPAAKDTKHKNTVHPYLQALGTSCKIKEQN